MATSAARFQRLMQFLFPLVCLCYSQDVPQSDKLYRREITEQDQPGAVCNDGTPGVFYQTALRDPTNPPSKFYIHLKGGYFCRSVTSCQRRCEGVNHYCTSSMQPVLPLNGIFSSDPDFNPYFMDYHKVSVHYCSSDMFIGQREASDDTGNLHFKGRAILTGVINAMKVDVGLGNKGNLLILGGLSAGGRGVAFNCEYIQSLLPGVDVRCLVDAAIFYPPLDAATFEDNCTPFNDVMQSANTFYHGVLSSDFNAVTWWKTFPLPLFISNQVFDVYARFYYCVNISNSSHVEIWSEAMQELSETLEKIRPTVGLYQVGCHEHPLLMDPNWFFNVRAGQTNLTLMETLINWIEGQGPIQTYDQCADVGIECNTACHYDPDVSNEWLKLVQYDD